MPNTPYKKQYDKEGNVTNPIKKSYAPEYMNRAERKRFEKNLFKRFK